MPDFDGPEEFLESLRDAEILTKPSSLLYVQALKFLETKATPPAARERAVRERRVRRASRKALMQGQGEPRGEPNPRGQCRPPTTRSARSTSSAPSASSTP